MILFNAHFYTFVKPYLTGDFTVLTTAGYMSSSSLCQVLPNIIRLPIQLSSIYLKLSLSSVFQPLSLVSEGLSSNTCLQLLTEGFPSNTVSLSLLNTSTRNYKTNTATSIYLGCLVVISNSSSSEEIAMVSSSVIANMDSHVTSHETTALLMCTSPSRFPFPFLLS